MATRPILNNDEMPTEIDFSKGTRGKFAKPVATLKLPIHSDADGRAYLTSRVENRGINVDQLANELLEKNIQFIEDAK